MRSFLKNVAVARSRIPESGWLYTFHLTIQHVVPSWLFSIKIWTTGIGEIEEIEVKPDKNLGLRWADTNDIVALMAMGQTREDFKNAFSNGEEIALCEAAGRIVAYYRMSPNQVEFSDWLRINLRNGSVYGGSLWVLPAYRGQDIGPELVRFGLAKMAEEGFQRWVFHVDALNRNSFRATNKVADTSTLGRLIFIRVLGVVFIKYGALSRIGFLNSQNRLVIELG